MKNLLAGAAALVLLGAIVGGVRAEPLAATGVSRSPAHAVVGSWSSARLLLTFSADGTVTGSDAEGLSYHGAWQPVGENGATYDLQTLLLEGGGQGLMGPLMVGEAGDEMITNGETFVRIVPPDPADYEISTPAAS